jgi:hypothetical protein
MECTAPNPCANEVLKVGEVSRRKQPVSPKLRSCEGGKRAKADCSPFYFLLSSPATLCVESAYLIAANERYEESFAVRDGAGQAMRFGHARHRTAVVLCSWE